MNNRIDPQRGGPAESFVSPLSKRQHTNATLATRTAIHASVFTVIVADAPAKHTTRMLYPWSILTDGGLLYRLRTVSFFLQNCGEERKKSKGASVNVSVPLGLPAARNIAARTSDSRSHSHAYLFCVLSNARIFNEKRHCSQSSNTPNANMADHSVVARNES